LRLPPPLYGPFLSQQLLKRGINLNNYSTFLPRSGLKGSKQSGLCPPDQHKPNPVRLDAWPQGHC
jgi:hypothetical protein